MQPICAQEKSVMLEKIFFLEKMTDEQRELKRVYYKMKKDETSEEYLWDDRAREAKASFEKRIKEI